MNSYEYKVTILDENGNVIAIFNKVYNAACQEDARDIAHIEAENAVEDYEAGDYELQLVDAY